MRRRNVAALVTVLALIAPLVVASAWVFANVQHNDNTDVIVEVQQGWGTKEVGDALEESDVIKSSAEFQQITLAAGISGFAAGRYVFVLDISARGGAERAARRPGGRDPRHPVAAPPGVEHHRDRRPRRQATGQEQGPLPPGRVVGDRPFGVRSRKA